MAGLIRSVWGFLFPAAAPTAPDGRSNDEVAPGPADKSSIFHDLTHMGGKSARTMVQAFTTLASGQPMDDKGLLLENGVTMLQTLPPNSGLGDKVAGGFIKMLWDDLPHPAGSIAGPTPKYRRHDGGGNNLWDTEMGKAGSAYSRSVPPMKPKGTDLPDPELVFEHLLKRKGAFRPHPSGLNRLFFSFATVVIHECFQTNREQPWINNTSSYVDLSTLYGNNAKEQERVRTYRNGRIFPDSIASERIMLMPPGVVAVLLMFSRNHNSIAETLLSINEQGKYKPWDDLSEKDQKTQDEDIFQLSRNINVGFFASCVLRDYVAAILNTPRANSSWSLDLGGEIKQGPARVERGSGNLVSVEFAVLYHWHATLSAADADWMEWLIKKHFPKITSVEHVTPQMFGEIAKGELKELTDTGEDASKWEFETAGYEYKRGKDGRFSDADLGKIIKDCIEEPAHAFGAHGTPPSLKIVDIMGQLQARHVFNVCTLNEFRRYLNLKDYESFEEWNPDKEVARAAELLYGHIENLELYPGLQAECTKPAMPGSGVCPGQTTGRGILDDAVALVRGDRFLTYDFNSTTLTNWGVSILGEIQGGAYGGILPRLLMKGLPGEFNGHSSYAILPFYTPTAVKGILEGNKVLDRYDIKRPESRSIVTLYSQAASKQVFEDHENFFVTLGLDGKKRHDERSNVLQKVFFEENFEANVAKYFRENVRAQIKKNSLKYGDPRRSIDVVRDVCNVVPVMWLAERFAIPIKSEKFPRGVVTLPALFDHYLALFSNQNYSFIAANQWHLRESVEKSKPILKTIIETHLKSQTGRLEGVVDWLAKGSSFEVKADADRLYHALAKTGASVDDVVEDCISMSAPVAGNLSRYASLLIDLYLKPGYETYKARIEELAQKEDSQSDKELTGFVYEGLRHVGVVTALPRIASKSVGITDGKKGVVTIKPNDVVLIATSNTAMDPAVFEDPETIDPNRPQSSYALLDDGLHFYFGARMIIPALTATLKEVFRLRPNEIAPFPKPRSGGITKIVRKVGGINMTTYLDSQARESPVPTSLRVVYFEK